MNKKNVQIVLAVLSLLAAIGLQIAGLDVTLVAAGASAIFSALAGYNTYNPGLHEPESIKSYDVPGECPLGIDVHTGNCCGNPYNCDRLIESDGEADA